MTKEKLNDYGLVTGSVFEQDMGLVMMSKGSVVIGPDPIELRVSLFFLKWAARALLVHLWQLTIIPLSYIRSSGVWWAISNRLDTRFARPLQHQSVQWADMTRVSGIFSSKSFLNAVPESCHLDLTSAFIVNNDGLTKSRSKRTLVRSHESQNGLAAKPRLSAPMSFVLYLKLPINQWFLQKIKKN